MTLERGSLFDPELVSDLINKVKGKSSLVALSQSRPIPFNGQKEFTFTMDSEIDVVAESGKKSHGGMSVAPRVIVPIKVEYGARVSDEFLYASEEEKINIIKAFNDGYARKLARGLDLMAFHGVNPRSGTSSSVIGDNHFDAQVTQTVDFNADNPDANIQTAADLIGGSDGELNGAALSREFASALANYKVNGVKQFPEFAWGSSPESVNGLKVDVNRTVSDGGENKNHAYLGDFQNMFKWGYAKEIPFEIIRYGDPDNSGNDLKGYNQVYLRSETYLGWGILDGSSFARVVEGDVGGDD